MAFPPHPLLDLTVPMVGSSFRFDLLDVDLNRTGTLDALGDSAVTIEHNVDRAIKRTLSGLRISPRDTNDVNPLTGRVQPVMTTADGMDWQLGVFLFSDYAGARTTIGLTGDASLQDAGLLLEQGVPRNISVRGGSDVRAAVISFLEEAGVTTYDVDSFNNAAGGVRSWKAGTPWRTVITDLASASGLTSPTFNHLGVCIIQKAPPASEASDVDTTYTTGETGRIIDGSVVEADNTLDAPNRYIAVDTTASKAPVVGVYDIPDEAPHSFANRGFAVTTTVEAQGLDSEDEAVAVAKAAYLRSRHMASVTFSSPPDPRHDVWNVIGYAGVPWRERRWSMSCQPGAPMAHEARRSFT